MPDDKTLRPTEIVIENVKTFMRMRALTQEELADRLNHIGGGARRRSSGDLMKWHRRTVNLVLSGERRLDIDELYALALALETTAGALQSTQLVEDTDYLSVVVGTLPPIDAERYEELNGRPKDILTARYAGVEDWDFGKTPRWVSRPSAIDRAVASLEEEYRRHHPDIVDLNAGEVLRWARAQAQDGDD